MSNQEIYTLILALITAVNSGVIWFLWMELKKSHQRVEQNHTSQQRQAREISQHRYSIALLSQNQKNSEAKSKKKLGSSDPDSSADEIVFSTDRPELEQMPETSEMDLPEGDKFDNMKNNEILEFVKKAVRNNQIALAQQPVVILPERQVAYYEIFSRIHVPGQGYIPAQKYISLAKSNNLMGAIDNMLLLRCLQLLKDKAEKDENIEFFINTNAQTFVNKDYLSGLIKFLAANPRLSSKLIFEMSQEDWMNLSASVKTVLDSLSLLGCRFSMDQITILGMDMARMMKQNISFVKLDVNILIKEIENTGDTNRVKRLKASLDAQRINVILEKVENDKQLTNLVELRPDFGQGYLFGAPGIIE